MVVKDHENKDTDILAGAAMMTRICSLVAGAVLVWAAMNTADGVAALECSQDCNLLLSVRDVLAPPGTYETDVDPFDSWDLYDLEGWRGVEFDDDEPARVVSIEFWGASDLSGQIPSEFGELDGLELLMITGTAMTGPIPADLGLLPKLSTIRLTQNPGLQSPIPTELLGIETSTYDSHLVFEETPCAEDEYEPNLTDDCNALISIRDMLLGDWQDYDDESPLNWSASRDLEDWDGITVEDLGTGNTQGRRVVAIDLTGNSYFRANTRNPVEVNMASAALRGLIPPSIAHLDKLDRLTLRDQEDLGGEIPAALMQMRSLNRIQITRSRIRGELPEDWHLPGLRHLDLRANKLNRRIPPSLGDTGSLEFVDLSRNGFDYEIPANIGGLRNLERLDLSDNDLEGEIPADIGRLRNLVSLDLSANDLSGSIPIEMDSLSTLVSLNLSDNELSGIVPGVLFGLSKLQGLDLSDNLLSGFDLATIGTARSLERLRLSRNRLSGIPSVIGNFSELEEITMSGNEMAGGIPVSLGDLTNLWRLDLSHNHLSGFVPVALGNLPLSSLLLQGNEGQGNELGLTGCIPTALQDTLYKMEVQRGTVFGSPDDEVVIVMEVLGEETREDGQGNPITVHRVRAIQNGDSRELIVRDLTTAEEFAPHLVDLGHLSFCDPPMFDGAAQTSFTVVENTEIGSTVATVIPVIAVGALVELYEYSLDGLDSRYAEITNTGDISLVHMPDFEDPADRNEDGVYSLTVTVNDRFGGLTFLDITITIENLVTEIPAKMDRPDIGDTTAGDQLAITTDWIAPENKGRPAIDDYDVQFSDVTVLPGGELVYSWIDWNHSGDLRTAEIVATNTITLRANTKYVTRVVAKNADGGGNWSDPSEQLLLVPRPRPPAPPRLTDESDDTNLALEARWTKPSTYGRASIVSYDLQYRTTHALAQPEAKWIDVVVGEVERSVLIEGVQWLSTNTGYVAKVRASDSFGSIGEWSQPSSATLVKPALAPDRPEKPEVWDHTVKGIAYPTLLVQWLAPTKPGGSDLVGYRLRYRAMPEGAGQGSLLLEWTTDSSLLFGPETTEAVISREDMVSGLEYQVQVQATNADRDSEWSAAGSATVDVNDPPEFRQAMYELHVREGTPAGNMVSSPLRATDRDDIGPFDITYGLSGNDSSFFRIGSNGQLFVGTTDMPSLGPNQTRQYRMDAVATDPEGLAGSASVTVIVEQNQPPRLDPIRPQWVAENEMGGAVVVTVDATDPNVEPLSFTLEQRAPPLDSDPTIGPGEPSWFTINDQREIVVRGAASVQSGIDREAFEAAGLEPFYELRVTASDGERSASRDILIRIQNQLEPPPELVPPSVLPDFGEGSEKWSLIVSWSAPSVAEMAGRSEISEYELRYWTYAYGDRETDGEDNWRQLRGVVVEGVTYLDDLERGSYYEIQVRAINSDGAGPWSASAVGETPDNSPPELDIRHDYEVAENAEDGTVVTKAYEYLSRETFPVVATDADGDSLVFRLLTNEYPFRIDPVSGVLSVDRGALQQQKKKLDAYGYPYRTYDRETKKMAYVYERDRAGNIVLEPVLGPDGKPIYPVIDYETTQNYELVVEVSDGRDVGMGTVRILVDDQAEPPLRVHNLHRDSGSSIYETETIIRWIEPDNTNRPRIDEYIVEIWSVSGRGADDRGPAPFSVDRGEFIPYEGFCSTCKMLEQVRISSSEGTMARASADGRFHYSWEPTVSLNLGEWYEVAIWAENADGLSQVVIERLTHGSPLELSSLACTPARKLDKGHRCNTIAKVEDVVSFGTYFGIALVVLAIVWSLIAYAISWVEDGEKKAAFWSGVGVIGVGLMIITSCRVWAYFVLSTVAIEAPMFPTPVP